MEAVYRDYHEHGVDFYFLYQRLARSSTVDFPEPLTLQDRLQHVNVAQSTLNSSFSWLCDSMDDVAKTALGNHANDELLIDPDGRVLYSNAWSDPTELRHALERSIGKVESVASLEDGPATDRAQAERLLARVETVAEKSPVVFSDRYANSLLVTPAGDKEQSHYLKVLATADGALVENGSGRLNLRFRIDPIYDDVHLNEVAPPLDFSIQTVGDVIARQLADGAVERESVSERVDSDCLLEVSDWEPGDMIEVTLGYSVCSGKWCKSVTRTYQIHMKKTPH